MSAIGDQNKTPTLLLYGGDFILVGAAGMFGLALGLGLVLIWLP